MKQLLRCLALVPALMLGVIVVVVDGFFMRNRKMCSGGKNDILPSD